MGNFVSGLDQVQLNGVIHRRNRGEGDAEFGGRVAGENLAHLKGLQSQGRTVGSSFFDDINQQSTKDAAEQAANLYRANPTPLSSAQKAKQARNQSARQGLGAGEKLISSKGGGKIIDGEWYNACLVQKDGMVLRKYEMPGRRPVYEEVAHQRNFGIAPE